MHFRRSLTIVGIAALLVAGACSAAATAAPTPAPPTPAPATEAPTAPPPSAAPSEAPSQAPASAAASISVPSAITSAGKLVFCTDISYAPEEFYAADGSTAQGSDIDIGTEIAKRFNVSVEFDNTGFDGIIPALLAKKCDLIISGMNDTPARAKQVDFVDYLSVGQGLLVPAGNPKGIHSLDDLSGKTVAVQLGTTNKDALDAENTKLKGEGKPLIDIQTFQLDTDAFQQLKLGRVDCYSTDSVVVAYYNSLPENKGKFEIGGTPIAPAPIGIAIRKDETDLKTAVSAAIDAMYADGTMKSIMEKWGMTNAVVFLK